MYVIQILQLKILVPNNFSRWSSGLFPTKALWARLITWSMIYLDLQCFLGISVLACWLCVWIWSFYLTTSLWRSPDEAAAAISGPCHEQQRRRKRGGRGRWWWRTNPVQPHQEAAQTTGHSSVLQKTPGVRLLWHRDEKCQLWEDKGQRDPKDSIQWYKFYVNFYTYTYNPYVSVNGCRSSFLPESIIIEALFDGLC